MGLGDKFLDYYRIAKSFDGTKYRLTDRLYSHDGLNCQEFCESLIMRALRIPNSRFERMDNTSVSEARCKWLTSSDIKSSARLNVLMRYGPVESWNVSAVTNQLSLNAVAMIQGMSEQNIVSIVQAVIQEHPGALEYASEELKGNRDLVLTVVQQCGSALQYAAADMKDDGRIVLAAVQNDGLALKSVSEQMKKNEWVVMAAVQENGLAIQYAAEEMKNNERIILVALQSFDQFTENRKQKYDEDINAFSSVNKGYVYVHLKAPAGAGKTLFAVEIIRDTLNELDVLILFAAPTIDLCYLFVQLLAVRMLGTKPGKSKVNEFKDKLKRVHFLSAQHKNNLATLEAQYDVNRSELMLHKLKDVLETVDKYALVVVDEYRYFHAGAGETDVETLKRFINTDGLEDKVKVLLLSDVSQCADMIDYDYGATTVWLMEVQVVRNRMPRCEYFIFVHDEQEGQLYTAYAKQVARAMEFVVQHFREISLSGRLAIIVPSQDFLERLKSLLDDNAHMEPFELLSAREACKRYPYSIQGRVQDQKQRIVLDHMGARQL